ncbi:flagellar hook-associated protein FlgL [Massilia sp. W12]|uniref:flagellar hook-associated protein FlgL n=1 Tax=Massilia sp. W12 TaxID=3126507 RepID=UPI0030D47EC0
MRVSTNGIFEVGINQVGTLQANLARTQLQLSTGRRNITAADDPIASARALEVIQSQSVNEQFVTNRLNAKSSLSQAEIALAAATTLLQDVKTIAINAGNGGLSDSDRASLATDLRGRLDDLLGLANAQDGVGNYLFSGFKSTTLPFIKTATGAQYQGDQGQRILQVGTSRQIPVSDSGNSIFEGNITGNGTFVTAANQAPPNRGSGIISIGSVTNAAQLTGENYSITFAISATQPPQTTFDVVNTTTNTPVLTGSPFVAGQPIAFDGLQFDISGTPANGDVFTVEPSQKQSIFTTLTSLINALGQPASGSTGQANLTNALNTANANLNNALDNMLSVRSTMGSHLRELDYLDSSGEDLDIQYKQTLSDLQDLDYTKALSNFAQQQTTLEAAQRSYVKIAGLSLFNYLS